MPAAAPLALEATALAKRYAGTTALGDVDLRVTTGSVHGLLGPNGAGKTTLLRLIFGLAHPDAGTMTLFGRPVTAGRTDPQLGGFVEAPQFYPHLSGRRNLEMLSAYDHRSDPAHLETLLEQVGLAQRAGDRVAGYSLGMRQRLGIAAALLRRPRLLVLDEPSNGLDPAGIRDLRTLTGELAADGLTILLSSHRMDEVEAVCDAVTILHRGAVAYAGTVDALRAQAPAPEYRLHTADDAAAVATARAHKAVTVEWYLTGGLLVRAQQSDLDGYVVNLGRDGIAVQALHRSTSALEQMFFRLTKADGQTRGAVDAQARQEAAVG
ncbi:ABC transporter ATP-binding protein [Rugosimonospora africana]|uniref:ABC transporter n=1 Tax=Rugosimonospora africana TaxID=556532 RepID=A0A8J3QSR6_9ACTN|nr:ABC transporter ATP-binding protein [Rugosimonospora africana]GIH15065.1 ABC transporter [Rugosimonospora africana]